MEFQLLVIFTFLFVFVVASNASNSSAVLSPAAYWEVALPNTPMPKAIKVLTSSDNPVNWTLGLVPWDVNISIGLFKYNYPASTGPLYDKQSVKKFFLPNDLKESKTLTLYFPKSRAKTALLPRHVSQKIPFSSERFGEILDRFPVVKPNSAEAKIMRESIESCEEPGMEGEVKYCATSLEAMIDFATSKLGKNVKALSTDVERQTQLQEYTISRVIEASRNEVVVCHKLNYVYAVFYCHQTSPTAAYVVSMVGVDGTRAEVTEVCHIDTSAWNSKHLAFQILKVKPGSVPICHVLPEGHVVWVPK